ncbi:alpha/beta hydrolase [Actinoplanes sp. SE50]|uniref:alpha/beta fold hydrolase n=1 Tax=unclassified Actinoplanes TaxID=2626549 RepID=UPI00023EC84A|nr:MULTISPECIES: alpha/beta fold hydrolase [unclassified Actinoplanes]AEV86482.1 alpha/beta hydrolase fold protein [Actinoplanes sp. SE50/110]ATO84880.1 alpha/beta hydrolase [Actinoplanes sp. SE50]SLM02289.1 alpha/beta hydrolase [Actinoplanes sp. SE50/110]
MATFRSDDGVEIYYEVREGGDGERPPVLLHHGFIADGRTNWELPGIVAALTGAGRRVVTIDARGHGRSGKPHDPGRYGESRMAEDVRALLDLLGATEVDLAGYSMGAIVALLTATRDTRVRRLVIGGVGAAVVELGGLDTRVVGGESLIRALRTDDPSTIGDPAAAGFRAFVEAVGGDRLALAAHAAAVHAAPIPLATITAPTLVLAGGSDPLAVRPEVLTAAIPGAVLRTVPGDHLSALRDPAFTPALLEFLNA